jgi:NitT/TauT family transport system substrate-binding protein
MRIINVMAGLCVMAILSAVNAHAQEKGTKIVLGAEKSFVTAAVRIAEIKGYFKEEGIDIELRDFNSGKASLAAMLNKKDVNISTAAQTPVVSNSFNRDDFSIIAAMNFSDNDIKVLARRDRGIKSPSDLKGKKIGITKGSTGHFFIDLFLSYAGIVPSDVETIDIKPDELPQALADGLVDAICTWEPNILNAEKLLGRKALILPSKGLYRVDFYFVVKKDFIKNNPETLERFLRAVYKGERFIHENNRDAMKIISEWLVVDIKTIAPIWDAFSFQLILDQSILMSLEGEARWAIKQGLTDRKEIPNYLDFIYMDALEKVKPEALTIIR